MTEVFEIYEMSSSDVDTLLNKKASIEDFKSNTRNFY